MLKLSKKPRRKNPDSNEKDEKEKDQW